MNKVLRVAAINDLSGFGRCSLTVAIPVISAFGIQVCPLPTAVLSSHTGFKNFTFHDLTPDMKSSADHWKEMNIKFDCIYSGFLGSLNQLDIVSDFFRDFGGSALKIVDPVMGDNGVVYKTYTREMCSEMKKLVSGADVITPNLTEAAILLNRDYPENRLTLKEASKWLKELLEIGTSKAVITGIMNEGKIYNIGIDKDNNEYFEHSFEYIKSSYSGTGDIFASCITGYLLSGLSFKESVYSAGRFIHDCVEYSLSSGLPQQDGVLFEPLLNRIAAKSAGSTD